MATETPTSVPKRKREMGRGGARGGEGRDLTSCYISTFQSLYPIHCLNFTVFPIQRVSLDSESFCVVATRQCRNDEISKWEFMIYYTFAQLPAPERVREGQTNRDTDGKRSVWNCYNLSFIHIAFNH